MLEQNKNEKERLGILEQKVDIQKKRLEIWKEKMNLEIIEKRKVEIEENRLHLDKIARLSHMISDFTIDEERTLFASEPFLKPTFTGKERNVLQTKLFELLKEL